MPLLSDGLGGKGESRRDCTLKCFSWAGEQVKLDGLNFKEPWEGVLLNDVLDKGASARETS